MADVLRGLTKAPIPGKSGGVDEKNELDPMYRLLAEELTKKIPLTELPKVIFWMAKFAEANEQVVAFHEEFDTEPFDGAVAFFRAMQETFGFVEHKGAMGFFGPSLPQMIGVQTGVGETMQVPWGMFCIPGYDELTIVIGTHPVKETFHFCISGQVKAKDRAVISALSTLIRKNLVERSIYRGKAISLKFTEDFDPRAFSPGDVAPEFLDLSSIDPSELILPREVFDMVQDSIFTPVEKTELCKEHGIRIGRHALLAGTYGVGKTLTANILALKAVEHGWTFVYLKDVKDLAHGLRVAKRYAPAIVFAEDIDSVMAGQERTEEMNKILNAVDGIEVKGKDIMVVLTTNHVERINQAMIRPGRVDALIEITPPDAEAAERLARVYGKKYIDPNEDLTKVGIMLAGQRPAMIAEAVERAKLSAITRMEGPDEKMSLVSQDLSRAASSLKHHISLVDRPQVEPIPKAKGRNGSSGTESQEAEA